MSGIYVYLTFDGNCREAMQFYQECLGGELFFQTVGESPPGKNLEDKMKSMILHATLINGNKILMASDMTPETGISRGNTLSLFLECDSESEINNYFNKLVKDCRSSSPPGKTHYGDTFGNLTDKFGIHWMLSYSQKMI